MIDPRVQRVVFVDDNCLHLERVEVLGIETHLAGWGYTGPEVEQKFNVIQALSELVQ